MRSCTWRQWLYRTLGVAHPTPTRRTARPCLEPLEVRSVPAIVMQAVQNIAFVEGQAKQVVVARFTDSAPTANTNYQASINWGDGTSTITGGVGPVVGEFVVTGNHKYAEENRPDTSRYIIVVRVEKLVGDRSVALQKGSAAVSEPPLRMLSAPTVTVTGLSVKLKATFIDDDGVNTLLSDPTKEYSVLVRWGDNLVSGRLPDVLIQQSSSGTAFFTITATHTYKVAGMKTIRVFISHAVPDLGTVDAQLDVRVG
jgi:hypothetical protein